MTSPASIVVIGMGNPMRRDDGVGHAVLAELEGEALLADDSVDLLALDGETTRLIEAWRDRRRAIVVDAGGRGDTPGALHRLDVRRDGAPGWTPAASSHASGLAEAMALGEVLDALPDELIVLAVEPGDLTLGSGLSAPVAAAVPRIADRVRREVLA